MVYFTHVPVRNLDSTGPAGVGCGPILPWDNGRVLSSVVSNEAITSNSFARRYMSNPKLLLFRIGENRGYMNTLLRKKDGLGSIRL